MFHVHLTFTEIFQHSHEFIFLYLRFYQSFFMSVCASKSSQSPKIVCEEKQLFLQEPWLSEITPPSSQLFCHRGWVMLFLFLSLQLWAAGMVWWGHWRFWKVHLYSRLEGGSLRDWYRWESLLNVWNAFDVVGYWKGQCGDILYFSYYQQIHKWTRTNHVWVCLLKLWLLYSVWSSQPI